MKYFIDTEFMEDGKTITLLSLAIVAEDGRELYIVNESASLQLANSWVKRNVIPSLLHDLTTSNPKGLFVQAYHSTIAQHVLAFVGNASSAGFVKPEFWGYFADYDWVVFCQLFGTMMDLPKGWPMYCNDIEQLYTEKPKPGLPAQPTEQHHALADARWNRQAYEFLTS